MELKHILTVIAKNRLLFFLGALGIVILLFGGTNTAQEEKISPIQSADAYRVSLEASLTDACRAVKGVGDVKLFLTLETSEIAVYEKNTGAESETLASVGGEGVLLTYRMPKVAGVAVICEGGENARVQYELSCLLCTALALDSTAVHIAPMK